MGAGSVRELSPGPETGAAQQSKMLADELTEYMTSALICQDRRLGGSAPRSTHPGGRVAGTNHLRHLTPGR